MSPEEDKSPINDDDDDRDLPDCLPSDIGGRRDSATSSTSTLSYVTARTSFSCGPEEEEEVPPLALPRCLSVSSSASAAPRQQQQQTVHGGGGGGGGEPPDGGWGWMVVVGSVISGCLIPTLFTCFGIFINAFIAAFPGVTRSSVAWIPSIMNAIMNGLGPITSALVNRYSARVVTYCGAIVLSLGLVLSYFSKSVQMLYLTYGILGGIGAGLSLSPGFFMISQYFKKRRGVATGICMAGGSFGQVCFPYIIQYLLDEYNYNGCFLLLGGITMNICVSASLFRPLESSKTSSKSLGKVSTTKTRPRRSVSATSQKSTLVFLPEDVAFVKNGSSSGYSEMISSESRRELGHKRQKKKKKKTWKDSKGDRKKKKNCFSNQQDDGLTTERNWQIVKSGVALQNSSSCGRSRSVSIESSRILPGIPEEREDVDGSPKEATIRCCNLLKQPNQNLELQEPKEQVIVSAEAEINFKQSTDNGTSSNNNNNSVVTSSLTAYNTKTSRLEPSDVVQKDDDEAVRTLLEKPPQREFRSNSVSEVVLLNHLFGSVTSIVSLESTKSTKTTKKPSSVCSNVYNSLGFNHFKEKIFYSLSGSFTLLIVTIMNYTMFIPSFGISISLSREESAGLLSVIALSSLFGRLLLPSIADYVTMKRRHIFAMGSVVTTCAVLATVFIQNYTELVLCLIAFGFASGGCLAISINVFLDYVSVEKFTSFFGMTGLVVGIFVLFVTPLMGLMVDATGGYTATFATLSVCSAFSGLLLYLDFCSKTKILGLLQKKHHKDSVVDSRKRQISV